MSPRTRPLARTSALLAAAALTATGCDLPAASSASSTSSSTDASAGSSTTGTSASSTHTTAPSPDTSPADSTSGGSSSGGSSASVGDAQHQLEQLPIRAEDDVDYDRDEWQPSWRVLPDRDDHCNVRQYSLKKEGVFVDADGTDHDGARVDEECDPYEPGDPELDGGHNQWTSPYDGTTTRHSSSFDADHFIPLEEVARSGGADWSSDRKHEFGMYSPDVIVIVSAHSNRSKGSDDPDDWMPSQQSYHCDYATRWIQLKTTWELTIDQAEHDALADTLNDCS